MAETAGGLELGHVAALLAAGVLAVPVFRRLGLGSVLGYLAAGLALGPWGIGLFDEPEVILHVAEFGVMGGRSLMRGDIATTLPEPYVKPRREGTALNEEAAEALEEDDEREKAGA